MGTRLNKVTTKRKANPTTSTNAPPIAIPLSPLKCSERITADERRFLEAAERGDIHTVIRCLQPPNAVNVNCTNMIGRSAIQIAVDNENVEIVEVLLKQDGVEIGDALLYAIREGVFRIVEMLIDHPSITPEMLGAEWSRCKYMGDSKDPQASADYSPDISPVILAAQCNQFEILQLLLMRGAVIEKPHQLSCSCQRCQAKVYEDGLRHSLKRITTYKALASPAWISLTSPDPILTAFKLSWELERLAVRENEFKDTYICLSNQCKRCACDLLDQCRKSEEVVAVLNKETEMDSELEDDDIWERDSERMTLARLRLALKCGQKQFVAHPNCQQLLTSIWYEGLPSWRKRNPISKLFISIGLMVMLPFMAMYYWIVPTSRIGKILRSPFMKFLYHSTSFAVFLILLICASTQLSSIEGRRRVRGPPPTGLEWLIFLWVTGFIWSECKQMWEEGLKAYIRQWWNWLDFIMLSLYLTTMTLRFIAYFQTESGNYGPKNLDRQHWPEGDPTMVSEGLFAVANVFSFARIIFLFQADQYLGPLQISLGCMLIDIGKFMLIFFLVLTSFACGLNQLYWYYVPDDKQGQSMSFHTLDGCYRTLYWSLFSLTQVREIKVPGEQAFTETVGEFLFMAYHGMAIIVMINMLIAMMSSSFQNIEVRNYWLFKTDQTAVPQTIQFWKNHADMEWKFARSKLWIGYFDEGSTLPPPFNLIISPKSLYKYYVAVKRLFYKCCLRRSPPEKRNETIYGKFKRPKKVSIFATKESLAVVTNLHHLDSRKMALNGDTNAIDKLRHLPQTDYQDVMRRLVSRYIHQLKKQRRQNGVNEDDLLEIKQDISSLRYEIREDKKQESRLKQGHVEQLRDEILAAVVNQSREPRNWPQSPSADSSPPPRYDAMRGQDNRFARIYTYNIFGQEGSIQDFNRYNRTTSHHHVSSNNTASIDSDLYETEVYGNNRSPPTERRVFQNDIEQMKIEIMSLIYKLHDTSYERLGNMSMAIDLLPSTNSQLYQTHLYTQL